MKRQWCWADGAVILVVVGLMSSLLLMQVTRARHAARQTSCDNNLKQLGLAVHNYHSVYMRMPMGAGGTDTGSADDPLGGNAGRLSAFIGLSPFMEEQRLWEYVSNPIRLNGAAYPPMGPVPWYDPDKYVPWSQRPSALVCPEDPASEKYSTAASYVLNYGDGILRVGAGPGDSPKPQPNDVAMLERATQRGAFCRQRSLRFRDFLDGLSNTLMMAESKIVGTPVAKNIGGLALDPSLAIAAQDGQDFWPEGREACWADGGLRSSGFQTILPPDSPSATSDEGEYTAVMSASSHHGRGTHVLFCDGAVAFVTAEIDSGDATRPSVAFSREAKNGGYAPPGSRSPYGLWGALGSRANKEVIERDELDDVMGPPRQGLSDLQIAEIKQQPIRTWTAANGKSTMKGWLVSSTPNGEVTLINEAGERKDLTLSDLAGEDAYFIIESKMKVAMEARKVLLPQLKEAVALLEKKAFPQFIQKFAVITPADIDAIPQLSAAVYQRRGMLIQSFDDAIRAMEGKNPMGLEFDDSGLIVRIGGAMPGGEMFLRYSDGRWVISTDRNLRMGRRGNGIGMRAMGMEVYEAAMEAEIEDYEVMMEAE